MSFFFYFHSFASHLAEQSAKEEEQKSSQPTTKSESLTAPLLHNLDCNIEEELDETDKGLTSGYVKFDSPQPSRAGKTKIILFCDMSLLDNYPA